jgi:hypothetical protein
MQRYIYNNDAPYITEDEHKIDEAEFAYVRAMCANFDADYFYTLAARVFPDKYVTLTKTDRLLTKALGSLGRYTAGRIVFEGLLHG